MRPDLYLIDGAIGGTPTESLSDSLYNQPKIEALGPTSVKVTIDLSNVNGTQAGHATTFPTSYRVYYYNTKTPTVSNQVSPDPTTTEFTITGLTEGESYNLEVIPYFGSDTGGRAIVYGFSPLVNYAGNATLGLPASPKKITSNEKLGQLTLSASETYKKYAVATRSLTAITVPSSTPTALPSAPSNGLSYPYYSTIEPPCFSFGTSLLLSDRLTMPKQGGGIGFFTDTKGNSGYYVLINTIPSAITKNLKSVRIVKVVGGSVIPLTDSQQGDGATLDKIIGGAQYNIDIKVKLSGFTASIIVYINGFQITATDTTKYTSGKLNKIIDPTNNVSLVCNTGTVNFDYVYGKTISLDQYKNSLNSTNFYQGQFSNDLISTSYGDVSYFNNSSEDNVVKGSLDEFGTVGREIKYVSAKYNAAFPIKWSTGILSNASLVSSSFSPFKGEAYILNNTSRLIPLSDESSTFGLFGNTLGKSGVIEYTTGDESNYAVKEPITIETNWLQTATDVKKLADWIKEKVINRGKVVVITTFGNPLLSVGDIVAINYSYYDFDGTQKLIVTDISQSFSEGVETKITCRTL